MKNQLILAAGLAALAPLASAQTVINLTGATAFRAASNNTILNLLGGDGVVEYAYTGTQQLGGSNRVIFKGNLNGDPAKPYIVRTSWSGSTQGILDLADQNSIQFLKTDVATSTTGINNPGTAEDFTTAVPRWSFSDVDKLLSQRPNAPLAGGPVGVVPFMFIAGESAPAGVTNMTDQLHGVLWGNGNLAASFFTGNAADENFFIFATGRNNGSGTRATILAETQYGAFTNVVQWNSAVTGDRLTGSLTGAPMFFKDKNDLDDQNGGNASNSGVRDLVTRASNPGFIGGNYAFVSYLTISDALSATGYNPVTGTVSGGEGAKPMTYNGVRYSVDNVVNGAYSLWGYQQLYLADGATPGEIEFDTALRAAIPTYMGNAGIPIPDMNVDRVGGDGGLITPQD
jgi:hypothetical protein